MRVERTRATDVVRRELRDVELKCVEPGCHPRFHDRGYDMNDEYQAPSHAVWKALAENDEGLRFIDFAGAYISESIP